MLRYLILGLLRDSLARHGYALMKECRDRCGIQVSIGNVYRELQQLAAKGLVRMAGNPPGADPRRVPYQVTTAGSAALDRWLARSSARPIGERRDVFSLRAFLIERADPALGSTLLEEWRDELSIRRRVLERAHETSLSPNDGVARGPTGSLAMLIARRLKHVSADLECVGELRSACEARVAKKAAARAVSRRAARARQAS